MAASTKASELSIEPGAWNIDPAHSAIEFTARHLVVTKVRGSFSSFTASIEVAEDLTQSKIKRYASGGSVNVQVPCQSVVIASWRDRGRTECDLRELFHIEEVSRLEMAIPIFFARGNGRYVEFGADLGLSEVFGDFDRGSKA